MRRPVSLKSRGVWMEETENEMLHLEKPTDYQLLKMKYVKNGMSYPTFILQKRLSRDFNFPVCIFLKINEKLYPNFMCPILLQFLVRVICNFEPQFYLTKY